MEAFRILPDERPFSFLTAEKRNCQSESTNPSCKKDFGGVGLAFRVGELLVYFLYAICTI